MKNSSPKHHLTTGRHWASGITALCLATSLAQSAVADELSLDEGWRLLQSAEVTTRDGSPAMRFESGRAVHESVRLENGTIELEMLLSGFRAFVYLQFRVDPSGENGEEIYFRTHKTRAPDALQYTPVDNGMSAWQLYHGKGKTAAVELPAEQWIPVKLVVEGSKGAIFVGETGKGAAPDLVIARLARKPQAGTIALRGFVPGEGAAPFSAYVRNLRVRPGHADHDFAELDPPAPPPAGTIEAWRLGESFVPESLTLASLDEVPVASRKPTVTVSPDPEGLVNIGRHLPRPAQGRPWATVAMVTLEAPDDRRPRLELGYSDAVSVFLDGELLFQADDSYSYDEPRRQGLIGLFQATVVLPLEKGENELEIVVADRFGGWGLMGRLLGDGVAVLP